MDEIDAATDHSTAPGASPASRHDRWPLVVALAAAVVLIAGSAVAVVVARRDDGPEEAAPQIGWMVDACRQWAGSAGTTGTGTGSGPAGSGPTDAWCTSMAAWMNDRMASDQPPSMMGRGPMMWQSPAAMRSACEQWMSTGPPSVPAEAEASDWCDQMVTWMEQNMGDWDGWMRNGPMAGRPATTGA